MAKPLQTLSPKHDAIAEWMIAHPDATKLECSRAFGVSPSFIYSLTNSDLFREYLRARSEETFNRAYPSLREKVAAVAEVATEKLLSAVAHSSDGDYILEVADKMLHRLGYAPTKGPTEIVMGSKNVQNNSFAIPREVLAQARERVLQNANKLPPAEGV